MTRVYLWRLALGYHCAQCGEPIAFPDWVEQAASRVTYLWTCRACDYRFEAIAVFDDGKAEAKPLAA